MITGLAMVLLFMLVGIALIPLQTRAESKADYKRVQRDALHFEGNPKTREYTAILPGTPVETR